MLRHLIRLIWNKKRSNSLLITEIFASFMVLFGVMSLVIYNFSNFRQPLGFDYENIWTIGVRNQGMPDSVFYPALERAFQQIVDHPEVESAAFSSFNTPFSSASMRWGSTYNGKDVNAEMIAVDQHYAQALGLRLEEGRWIEEAEIIEGQRVVVLNRQAREALFGDEPALGKTVTMEEADKPWKVVGVLGNFKPKSEFFKPEPVIFQNHKAMTRPAESVLIKVNERADAVFEAALLKELNGIVKGANLELSYLRDQRRNQHSFTKVPMIIAGTVCGFLLINVGLGLFGVLWFTIRKRREEIGLRRALGATHQGIIRHFIGEAIVLAGFGILIGLFFALQFPLLDVFGLDKIVYFQATIAAIVVLLVLVAICALYPSRQASQIQPAMALHEE